MKIRFRELLSRKQFIAVVIFFLGCLAYFYFTFFTPNYYEGQSPKKFEIAKGETFNDVVDRLYGEGIIPSKIDMRIAGFIYGAGKKIRAARYQIPNGLSYLDLLNLFIYGDAEFMRTVTIRDGLSIGWMSYVFKKDALIDSTEFVTLAFNKYFVDSLGIKKKSLEGYLFPGTYEIYEKSSAKEVILKMYNEFQKFMNDSLKARANKIGLTVHQALTLASIIKGETSKADEMPAISGVYHNRLRIGMRLQADPTGQYLLKGGWRRLLHKDLLLDSPYNTYKYAGLPPGPINNPGKNAILAALYPENHKYLFFVADGKGGHRFSNTYAEHLRKVNEYRKSLKSKSN
ncbi:MAG TPA: endolytic transglycosylase MltG [Ignavibacteriaceae bacterium]|nr:endolytic transglycosylase MltG [Ignavibacteriaceae bacterium]